MFKYEKEMIPVLIDNLSKVFKTEFITTEFNTGNGIADLVFTTVMNEEKLFLNDYSLMSLFVNLFKKNRNLNKELLNESKYDRKRLAILLKYLENDDFISYNGNNIITNRKYKSHTQNLFSIEAKLKDWKSGFYQAMRYKFYSHKTYLAFPEEIINRVDLDLLKENNIGLISVKQDSIRFVFKPKNEKPKDQTAFYFLSEMFSKKIKTDTNILR